MTLVIFSYNPKYLIDSENTKLQTKIKIGSCLLKNPITVASGTAGYGEELANFFDLSQLGALFTKGLSLEPRVGNQGNRIVETTGGILNSIGLENVGLEIFLEKKLPFLLKNKATVIPNLAGHSEDENVELAKILSGVKGIAAIELNLSCPNVKEGGMIFGTDENIFSRVVEKVRKVSKVPLIVKLTPNVTDITKFALLAEKNGAEAVSAVNTFLGMKIDPQTKKPYFKNKMAGLSGPAIKPLALRAVYQIYEKVTIPIIGLGGISTLDDVLEFILAGASAVSLGTINLVEPQRSVELVKELKDYLAKNKIKKITEIVGQAH